MDQGQALGLVQAFIGATAVRASEAASAQLDTAIPADHQHYDLIAILRFDRCQNGPAGRTSGLSIVVAAVLIGQFPGPAIVRGIQIAVLLDERLGLGSAGDGGGEGNKAAFANLFPVFARASKGKRHAYVPAIDDVNHCFR
jgi:hypothetical protein